MFMKKSVAETGRAHSIVIGLGIGLAISLGGLLGGCGGELISSGEQAVTTVAEGEGAPMLETFDLDTDTDHAEGGNGGVAPPEPPPAPWPHPVESQCEITLHQCVKHPCVGSPILDSNNSCAGVGRRTFADAKGQQDLNICMQRAAQYAHWCGNPAGSVAVARYKLDGFALETKRYRVGDGCMISLPMGCPAHPNMNSRPPEFHDGWGYARRIRPALAHPLESDKRAAHCKHRVSAFFNWCGICPQPPGNSNPGGSANTGGGGVVYPGVIGTFYQYNASMGHKVPVATYEKNCTF